MAIRPLVHTTCNIHVHKFNLQLLAYNNLHKKKEIENSDIK